MSNKKNGKNKMTIKEESISTETPIETSDPISTPFNTTPSILNMNAATKSIESQLNSEALNKIDLYIRTKGRRKETFVVGFSKPTDMDETKKLLKRFRTKYACIAAFSDDAQYGTNVLKLSGDVRSQLAADLVKNFDYTDNNVIIHG